MSLSSIRILGIAPYESMRTVLMHAADSFPSIELDVRIGDLEEGAQIVRQLCEETEYDAIISRGGTAKLIRSVTNVPVIDIAISVYDVLRTIRLAEKYSGRCAVVGFSSITEPAHILCDMLRYRIDILTVNSQEEVRDTLMRLKKLSIQAVVCDAISHRTARELGFSAFLIASGEESLHDALQQAQSIGQVFQRMRRRNAFLSLLLREEEASATVLDENGTILHYTRTPPSPELLAAMRQRLHRLKLGTSLQFYHQEQDELYTVNAQKISFDGHPAFTFRSQAARIPTRAGRLGLRFLDRPECEQLFLNSFYAISGAMGELEEQLPGIAESRQSVLILGENGTGREQIARALYLRSRLVNKPLAVVDCAHMDDKTWEYLFEHHASPLAGRDQVVFFQNLDMLSDAQWPILMYNIAETGLAKRIWLLFSCTQAEGQPVPQRIQQFASGIGCLLLHLPSLRSRPDELPSLAYLYISSLNLELGKQITGFDPGAMEQLVHYSWPNNYTQFKHVLHELAIQTQSYYISSNACFEVLRKEKMLSPDAPPQEFTGGIPYRNRSLNDIDSEIVRRVLSDNRGNQTLTAKQLGISRTTLWRFLRTQEPSSDT